MGILKWGKLDIEVSIPANGSQTCNYSRLTYIAVQFKAAILYPVYKNVPPDIQYFWTSNAHTQIYQSCLLQAKVVAPPMQPTNHLAHVGYAHDNAQQPYLQVVLYGNIFDGLN